MPSSWATTSGRGSTIRMLAFGGGWLTEGPQIGVSVSRALAAGLLLVGTGHGGVDFAAAVGLEQQHIVSHKPVPHLHSRAAHRHAGHRQTDGPGGRVGEELLDIAGGHMALEDIVVGNYRRVAGLVLGADAQLALDPVQVLGVVNGGRESAGVEVVLPQLAATAGGAFVEVVGQGLGAGNRTGFCPRGGGRHQQDKGHQDACGATSDGHWATSKTIATAAGVYCLKRSLRALLTTDTELRLMAKAAIIGESSSPVKG